MKRVFISHPYKDDPKGNKKRVDTICRELAEKDDILPISPLHLFSFMEDDLQREEILQVCYSLIDICDEVWIYGDSEGCKREAEYAQRAGKVVMFEKIIPEQELEIDVVVRIPPIRERFVRVKVKTVEKAMPNIVEPGAF